MEVGNILTYAKARQLNNRVGLDCNDLKRMLFIGAPSSLVSKANQMLGVYDE